ncbi:succinate dehydrogenase / fumarate reductase cytochrome b subunit [Flexibacter flexilis DSM 6793]|uniref:Succinate dehydrogenase / fumarate reductase cytochrome b subunit n=1 Tax=Flexibacter flexilis DSM 6793 TaxID=927664 RepID=A0A1I1JZ19_9BACT|nr:succinate dehydrogenase cytochrome b subunit [Flexibacter flexilis]SFC53736.1 succinate dehydrogenase / fumarate reductase cytochrome b subunit [Flexibacter flexilis DSM 6793]
MSWISQTLSSSIGRKLVMALTGLFLCTFLAVHMIGNLQLFKADHGLAFNEYAVLMTTNPLIKTVSYGLYFFILLHAFQGFALTLKNKKARPVAYAVSKGSANSSAASRNMALLGTVLLVFIAVHMGDFWAEYKFGHVPYTQFEQDLKTGEVKATSLGADFVMHGKKQEYLTNDNQTRVVIVKDLYEEVEEEFKNIALVAFYLLAMAAVSFHLIHGFKSAFQTLGVNHPKYNGAIQTVGIVVFGVLIPLAFAAMPVYFFLKG